MIKIEKNIPIEGRGKYKEYIQAMVNMRKNESFVVDGYKIVDALRGYAWRKGHKISFREIKKSLLYDAYLNLIKTIGNTYFYIVNATKSN